jgi:hypothetical protein
VVVIAGFGVDQDSAQEYEIAKFWMNQVAVNPHMAKPGLHGDRLVGHHPNRAATGLIHFHGKTH